MKWKFLKLRQSKKIWTIKLLRNKILVTRFNMANLFFLKTSFQESIYKSNLSIWLKQLDAYRLESENFRP